MKKFIKFLKDEGVFQRFVYYTMKRYKGDPYEFLRRSRPDLFVLVAFPWKDTVEGDVFWFIIHLEWVKSL